MVWHLPSAATEANSHLMDTIGVQNKKIFVAGNRGWTLQIVMVELKGQAQVLQRRLYEKRSIPMLTARQHLLCAHFKTYLDFMERNELVTIYATSSAHQVRHCAVQTTKFWTSDFRVRPPSNKTITAGRDRSKVPTSLKAKQLIQVRLSVLFLPENMRTSLI